MHNMGKLRTICLIVGLCVGMGVGSASGQAAPQGDGAKRLIGTWRLVSHSDPSRGPRPTGLIYYDANGNMAAQIMPDHVRPKYAGTSPTPDEAKAAITGYTAYFGTYTIDGERGQSRNLGIYLQLHLPALNFAFLPRIQLWRAKPEQDLCLSSSITEQGLDSLNKSAKADCFFLFKTIDHFDF